MIQDRSKLINLKKAIEATESTEYTENTRVSKRITPHQNSASLKVPNLLFFLCDLCVLCG